MCFVNDYDWTAEKIEEYTQVSDSASKCEECCRTIDPGGTIHVIEMWEYESCQRCEDSDCDCGDGGCCKCDEPDKGEYFRFAMCSDCHKFRAAIRRVEEAAGCGSWEAEPPLGEMIEAIRENGAMEAKRHFVTAVRLSPESRSYLAWLWRKLLWIGQ